MWFLIIFSVLLQSVYAVPEDDLLKFLGQQYFKHVFDEEATDLVYEFTSPQITDVNGNLLKRYERNTDHPDEHFFSITAFGQKYQIHLKKNNNVMANDLEFTAKNPDGRVEKFQTDFAKNCLYQGKVVSHQNLPVSISTCDGLTGLIHTPNEYLIIQSLPDNIRSKRSIDNHDHIVYRKPEKMERFCGSSLYHRSESSFMRPFNYSKVVRQAQNAAYANKITVETAVFFDLDLYNHFLTCYPYNTEAKTLVWILAVVNAMQSMYNDGTLTRKIIQFVIIKVEIFKTRQVGFQITKDAEAFLNNFCSWQSRINTPDDRDPRHWDHALMFTGLDIEFQNLGSSCAGLAPVSGMCVSQYTCTLSEGKGFLGVFVVTHECGHNFGMEHDGQDNKNQCDPSNFMMSPAAHVFVHPWSQCSSNYFANYMQNPVTVCLLDERQSDPLFNHEKDNNVWMGQRYDADAQCQIEFGNHFLKDRSQNEKQICEYISCVNNIDVKYAPSAFEGTTCGQGQWCSKQHCVPRARHAPIPNAGSWGEYYELIGCSSSCLQGGTGIVTYERDCISPWGVDYLAACRGNRILFNRCEDNTFCRVRNSIEQVTSKACRTNIPPWASNLTGRGGQSMEDETGGCRVWCEYSGNQWTNWGIPFPDGTPCVNNGFCVRGMCFNKFPVAL